MRKLLLLLTVVCGITWGTAFYLILKPDPPSAVVEIPTLRVLPSLTPSQTSTNAPTDTHTFTPTTTPSATTTAAPTATATLSTRVLAISSGNPDASLIPAVFRRRWWCCLLCRRL